MPIYFKSEFLKYWWFCFADCELVALLEDDTGMELLVNNKIISLELPVKDVFKKIWVPDHGEGEAMRIVYRMRGLLGGSTMLLTQNYKSL